MENKLPKEVNEMVQGAIRMMIEDGVTHEMFYGDMHRMTRVYIKAYARRQASICMNCLTCESIRTAALVEILSTLVDYEKHSS